MSSNKYEALSIQVFSHELSVYSTAKNMLLIDAEGNQFLKYIDTHFTNR